MAQRLTLALLETLYKLMVEHLDVCDDLASRIRWTELRDWADEEIEHRRQRATIQFPRPAETGATHWQIWHSRMVVAVGRLLAWFRVPGGVRNTDIADEVSGYNISVRIGPLFTCITVNGRNFYFNRFTGKFDGAGSACRRSER